MSVKRIDGWDWPSSLLVPDGWDSRRAPELSRENLEFLADKFNELVDILDAAGLLPTEEDE